MIRRRLLISGVVQGVGFRPFVWRRATRLGLAGGVENSSAGVVVDVQGPAAAVAAFQEGLAATAPPLAVIDAITVTQLPPAADVAGPFRILATGGGDRPHTLVPADVATCAACLTEFRDPADRRHGHAFISCTDCGPRFTIIARMPYDRTTTTMRTFPMCPRCAAEYATPADRRFHAEPIACPECGPVVWFARAVDGVRCERPANAADSGAAIAAARRLLAEGSILAIKSLGGFHLACDATNARAIALIRTRKRRPAKPLAVLVTDLEAARRIAVVDEQAARLLTGPERPIVLVPKRPNGAGLPEAIAPANGFLGVMLPAAPLQHLLAAGLPPLVMTSGNLTEEPIATDNDDAVRRLSGIADGFLLHDRGIHVPCDDSVVRCVAGAVLPIRRSRGHAPLPIRLTAEGPAILAVGGERKAALCLTIGDRAIMGQHIGDMGNLETLAAIQRAAGHLLALFAAEPAAVVADLHPGYLSADWAARFAAARGIPLIRVQHHEAHVASLLAEHWGAATPPHGRSCLVACFDGTGYAADGTIRGGEFFRITARGIERVAHLAPFPLPGGDAAIRHPWRAALAVLHAAGLPWQASLPPVQAATDAERRVLARQLEGGFQCLPTTSMGRLFDAVAALVGLAPSVTYEAEAALELESLAATAGAARRHYAFSVSAAAIDWRPVVTAIVADVLDGVPAAAIAAGFHDAVAALILAVAERFAAPDRSAAVGLTGGVFQNAVLTEATLAGARAAGRELLVHHEVPPNDGGLALGQAVLGRERLAATAVSLP